jgi:hypothetical protein
MPLKKSIPQIPFFSHSLPLLSTLSPYKGILSTFWSDLLPKNKEKQRNMLNPCIVKGKKDGLAENSLHHSSLAMGERGYKKRIRLLWLWLYETTIDSRADAYVFLP